MGQLTVKFDPSVLLIENLTLHFYLLTSGIIKNQSYQKNVKFNSILIVLNHNNPCLKVLYIVILQ